MVRHTQDPTTKGTEELLPVIAKKVNIYLFDQLKQKLIEGSLIFVRMERPQWPKEETATVGYNLLCLVHFML